ncbi:MAG: aminoacyl-tRNA hydrolase [Actinomycetota bacterium]
MRFGRRTPREDDLVDAWLVVGLGNPGSEYERTRHNVGFRVADLLAERFGARFKRGRSSAMVAETRDGHTRVVLAKPTTYMNLSGNAIAPLAKYFKVPNERIVVVHDEIDLPFGALRVKMGGGTAGHNGLRSIQTSLGTPEFPRVRIGVGRPAGRKEAADHVLDPFTKAEEKEVPIVVAEAADAVQEILRDGVERTQTRVNARD